MPGGAISISRAMVTVCAYDDNFHARAKFLHDTTSHFCHCPRLHEAAPPFRDESHLIHRAEIVWCCIKVLHKPALQRCADDGATAPAESGHASPV